MSSSSSSSSSSWPSRELSSIEREAEELKSSLQCPVCLDTFSLPVMILPCLHSFCGTCLDKVLEVTPYSSSSCSSSGSCPSCRRSFSVSKDEPESPVINRVVHSQLERLKVLTQSLESDDEPMSPVPRAREPSDATKKLRNEALQLVEEVEARGQDLHRSLSFLDQMEEEIADSVIPQHTFIEQTFEIMKQRLERRKLELIEEFNLRTAAKLESLGQQRKTMERDVECLENSVTVSRSMILNGTDEQFSEHRERITNHLNRLIQEDTFLQPPVETSHLELTPLIEADIAPFFQIGRVEEVQSKKTFAPLFIRYKAMGTPKQIIGSKGKAPLQFDSPSGLFVDNFNRLVVCDGANNRIQVIDSQGKLIRCFGEGGFTVGKMDRPSCVIVDKNENFVVCDSGNHRIHLFDPTGNHISSFGSYGDRDHQFKHPNSFAITKEGNCVVTDSFGDRAQIFDPEWNLIKTIGGPGKEDGRFHNPKGVAIDPVTNNIVVSDSNHNRIQVFDHEGNFLFTFGKMGTAPGQLCTPCGLAIDQRGNIVVCDLNNHRIQVFDRNGDFVHSFGSKGNGPGQFDTPFGVVIDNKGNVIVSDWNNHRIQVF